MNDMIQCGELQVEAKQLLRYRVPLVLAILVNGVLIARIPVATLLGQGPPPNAMMTGQVEPSPGQSPDTAIADSRTEAGDTALGLDVNDSRPRLATSPAVGPETVRPPTEGLDARDAGDIPIGPWSDAAETVPKMPATRSRTVDPGTDETGATGECDWDVNDLLRTTQAFTRDAGQVVGRFLAGLDDWRSRVGDWPMTEVRAHGSHQPNPATLILRNRLENQSPVRFLVQDRPRELWPGEALELPPTGPWIVAFHRGGDWEDTQHVLEPGAYQFEVTGSGWELRAVEP